MEKYDLMNSWIFQILRYVKKKRGYQNKMIAGGHFSAHLFSPKNPVWDITLEHAIRMVLLYAMVCSEKDSNEFMDDWTKLGEAIKEISENGIAERLNDLFNPKKAARNK